MVSKKYHHRKRSSSHSSKKSRKSQQARRGRSCLGGKSRRHGDKKKKSDSRKWHQKGCQSGGGSITGGWPWGASDVQHSGGGGGFGGQSPVPQSINGNHYSLNTSTLAPPQNSNHLVEKGQYGGKHTRKHGRKHGRKSHHKFIGEQRGGMAEYLPETANSSIRGVIETPSSIMNALQGDSTAFVTSNPTVQPIAQPVQLK
jgi:hypothetical protein